MKILVLGGTRFLGIHCVNAALAKGYEVVLFNRGKSDTEIFKELETIKGDRNTDLEKLREMKFDAVIDTSCYYPNQMEKAIEVLSENVDNYVFVSTISVYHDFKVSNMDEAYPLPKREYESTEITGESYGPLKAACEEVLEQKMKGKEIIVRPGLICGPNDATDRFTYYPVKVHFNDEVLLPEKDCNFQFIDVRDLSEFIIHLIENKSTGIYNATGQGKSYKMTELIEDCKRVCNPNCTIVPLSSEQMESYGIDITANFPFWIVEEELIGITNINVEKALASGLELRDPKETIIDTLNWYKENGRTSKDLVTGFKDENQRNILEMNND